MINVRGESFRPGVNMFRYSVNGMNHLEISRITCCFAVASLPLQTETIVYKVLRRKRFKIYASLEMVIIDKCHVYCDK